MNPANIDAYAPVTIAKIGGRELQCETPAGAAWLSKYLHPPSEKFDSLLGMPDENNQPSVSQEYRLTRDVTPSTSSVTGFLFLQLPTPGTPIIYWEISGGTLGNPSVIYYPSFPISQTSPLTSPPFYESSRVIYQSVTYSLDSTAFNNQGIVSAAQFRGEFKLSDTVTAAGAVTTTYTDLVLNLGSRLPTTGEQVIMLSPKAYSGLAREGCFCINRMSQPINDYKDQPAGAVTFNSTPTPGVYTVIRAWLGLALDLGIPNLTYIADGGANRYNFSNASDFTCAFVLFEGLSNTTIAGPPRINVKAISGYEFGIAANSVVTPFLRNPANYDFMAIQAASRVAHAMQDGMPASMNSFGSFIGPALKYAPQVISALTPILSKFFAKPTKNTSKSQKDTRAKPSSKPKVIAVPTDTNKRLDLLTKQIRAIAIKTRVAPKKRKTTKSKAVKKPT